MYEKKFDTFDSNFLDVTQCKEWQERPHLFVVF